MDTSSEMMGLLICLYWDLLIQNQTPQSIAKDIPEALSSFIKNPSVNVRILNFRVSILGGKAAGTFTVPKNVLLFLNPLDYGHLTINGDHNNVLIIRK